MSALFLACDPGNKASGLAWQWEHNPKIETLPVKGCPVVGTMAFPFDRAWDFQLDRALIVIERSTCTLPRFRARRAVALQWARYLRNRFARRNKIVFVDPRTWQAALGVSKPGPRTGILGYQHYAVAYGLCDDGRTEDEAAAACLLHYARKMRIFGVVG